MSVCFDPNGDVPGRLIAFFAAPYLHAANALVRRPALLVPSSMFEAGVKGEGAIDTDSTSVLRTSTKVPRTNRFDLRAVRAVLRTQCSTLAQQRRNSQQL